MLLGTWAALGRRYSVILPRCITGLHFDAATAGLKKACGGPSFVCASAPEAQSRSRNSLRRDAQMIDGHCMTVVS